MSEKQKQAASQAVADVGRAVVSHLDSETKSLCESITTLATMRRALAKNDTTGLKEALDKQRQQGESARELSRERESLKQEIAAVIGVPLDDATITCVAEHVDQTTREAILMRRHKLLQLHREAEAINYGNASLTAQSLALLRYCFASDQQAGTTTRYSASGEIEVREGRNTLEARA